MRCPLGLSTAILLTLTFVGCRMVSESIDYYKACKGDQACLESINKDAAISSAAVQKVVDQSSSTNTIGWIVGSIIGNLVAFFSGVYKGKKIVKEKEKQNGSN